MQIQKNKEEKTEKFENEIEKLKSQIQELKSEKSANQYKFEIAEKKISEIGEKIENSDGSILFFKFSSVKNDE